MKGIGEAYLYPRWWRWVHQKRRFAMQLKQKTVSEIIGMAAYKAAKNNKDRAVVFIPYPYLPPTRPFKPTRVDSAFGTVEIITVPKENGWLCKVRFLENKEGFVLKEVAKLS